MTDKHLELTIKNSFENIVPDINRKEEIYNKLLEISTKENKKPALLSFFTEKRPRIMPYALVCACLLLVCSVGFFGGFDFALTKDSMESAAYLTADFISESAAADAVDERAIVNECSEAACDEEFPEVSAKAQPFYTVWQDGSICVYTSNTEEYDPEFILDTLKSHSPALKNLKLNSFKTDESSRVIYLDFCDEFEKLAKNSKTYNHMVAVGETYCSFYPEFSFTVTVNNEPLIIDSKQVDFKTHVYSDTEK